MSRVPMIGCVSLNMQMGVFHGKCVQRPTTQAQRPGSRDALMTRQIAFEPLPASVLFAPLDSILKCDMVAQWHTNNWTLRKDIRLRQ